MCRHFPDSMGLHACSRDGSCWRVLSVRRRVFDFRHPFLSTGSDAIQDTNGTAPLQEAFPALRTRFPCRIRRSSRQTRDHNGMNSPRINGERLWDSLMRMSSIGATPRGGVCRLALTDLDRQGRELFVRWCKAAGCSVAVDRLGSIFARRAGLNPELPPCTAGEPPGFPAHRRQIRWCLRGTGRA